MILEFTAQRFFHKRIPELTAQMTKHFVCENTVEIR